MVYITQGLQWYLVSTDVVSDTIQSLSDRLVSGGQVVNLLDSYYVWNNSSNKYDK